MTLLALGVAVNLPEGRLHAILEGLVRSGQVRRRGSSSLTMPGPRTAQYHLATGRHSAHPGAPTRRITAGRQTEASNRERLLRDRIEPRQTALRPAPVPTGGIRSSRAHGV